MVALEIPEIAEIAEITEITEDDAPLLYNHAYAHLIDDPASLLALAGCWVTPFPDDDDLEEEEYSINAWKCVKDLYPDIGLGFSWAVWEGIPDGQIDNQMIRDIEARVPGVLFDIETVPYGPMYHFYGIDWHDIASYTTKQTKDIKRLKVYGELLNQIGKKQQNTTPYHHGTITYLAETLWKDQPEVSAFIQWMCHWSGNTFFDMTYDDYSDDYGYQGFEWTVEEIDTTWYAEEEAETFVKLSRVGQQKLKKTETFIQFCEALLKGNCLAITEVHHVLGDT